MGKLTTIGALAISIAPAILLIASFAQGYARMSNYSIELGKEVGIDICVARLHFVISCRRGIPNANADGSKIAWRLEPAPPQVNPSALNGIWEELRFRLRNGIGDKIMQFKSVRVAGFDASVGAPVLMDFVDLTYVPSNDKYTGNVKRWTLIVPPWFLIALGVLWPILTVRWVRHQSGHSRSRKGLCRHCGYDIRVNSGKCPECGAVIHVLEMDKTSPK